MQIMAMEIKNFKNLKHLSLEAIPQLIVIAGPNGSGKSALFDALRIFKEAHGGYSVRNPGASQVYGLVQQVGPVITVGANEARITVAVKVSGGEQLALGLPGGHQGVLQGSVLIRAAAPNQPESAIVDSTYPDHPYLQRLFGAGYRGGGELGVMDHIGPDRRFGASQVASINLSIEHAESDLEGLVLNSSAKFTNLTQDLVMMRLLDMQEREQNEPNPHHYIDRVREIFRHFLPDKELLDVKIPPGLSGPPRVLVRSGGVEHEINHLSSGQREILMTYTHLEKLGPIGSIILFDEPELHLHPALQRRVIAHLHRILERGNNQVWVITHSEEIVGTTDYESLYMMTGSGDPAIEPVKGRAERIELLQQLGANIGLQLVSPRILFLEGESDAELLPLFLDTLPAGVSLVETRGKGTLMRLTSTAMKLLEETIRDGQFYLVRDHDIEDDPGFLDALQSQYAGHFFVWDRYHIENYLLDEEAIYQVLADDPDIPTPPSPCGIGQRLRALAEARKDHVLAKRLEAKVNQALRRRLRLNVPEGVKVSLLNAAAAHLTRTATILGPAAVEQMYTQERAVLDPDWEEGWRRLCIGRDVLKDYHGEVVRGYLGYEVFRNRVARKIRDMSRVPSLITQVMSSVTAGLPMQQQ